MKEYYRVMQSSPLFSGIAEEEITAMLGCLSAREESFQKNQFILRCGESVNAFCMVLSGGVQILMEDFWGNRNILAGVGPGELFAEVYACMPGELLAVSVQAAEPSVVMFLDMRRLLTGCQSACAFHARLIRNLLTVLAEKNLLQTRKLVHMAQRSTREKLLSYLSAEAVRQGGPSFTIPFNRQELADYLSVDRSAMSNELGKMRDEGLLRFSRSSFTLHARAGAYD